MKSILLFLKASLLLSMLFLPSAAFSVGELDFRDIDGSHKVANCIYRIDYILQHDDYYCRLKKIIIKKIDRKTYSLLYQDELGATHDVLVFKEFSNTNGTTTTQAKITKSRNNITMSIHESDPASEFEIYDIYEIDERYRNEYALKHTYKYKKGNVRKLHTWEYLLRD